MRTSSSSLAALACIALTGCSLAYNGSRFQGGTGSDTGVLGDTGVPSDTGVDASTTDDTGVLPHDGGTTCHAPSDCAAMGTYCDTSGACMSGCDEASDCMATQMCNQATHVCTAMTCTGDPMCPMDTFCDGSACVDCDHDGDHYYNAHASMVRCARAGHLDGNDCNDGNAMVFPQNRADCSTPLAESCPLPVMLMPALPAPLHVSEVGVTPVHVLWTETGTQHVMGRDAIYAVAGDDSPQLPSGALNGFVAFVANDSSSRSVFAVPLAFDGAAGVAEQIFHGFHVSSFYMHRTYATVSGGMSPVLAYAVSSFMGGNMTGYSQTVLGHPASPLDPVDLFTSNHPILGGTGGFSSVSTVTSNGQGAGTVFTMGVLGSDVESFADASPIESGAANYQSGSWMVGSSSAVMWAASTSSVAIWNGNDSAISPPTVSLSSFTSTAPPREVSAMYRGSIDSRPLTGGGGTTYLAAVPVGTTQIPPQGRIALLRWTAPHPVLGDRTDARIPGNVVVSELDLGASAHLNGPAGVAVRMVDDASAIIAYQDGGDVVARILPVPPDPTRASPENPPAFPMLQLAAGETCTAIDIAGGFYPDAPGAQHGVGRFGAVCMVEHGTMPHQLRVRALEACITDM
jgi:hypothetical protein